MALRILRPDSFRVMPWKNGGGTTTELLILPEGATVAGGFDLRLSRAQVASSGPFSPFPGCDRTLLLLQGEGLRVALEDRDGLALERPFEPVVFSGDVPASGHLAAGPCEDFNVITRRRALTHHLEVLRGPGPFRSGTGRSLNAWFVAQGILQGAEAGSLLLAGPGSTEALQGSPEGLYLRIEVDPA